MRTPLTDRNAFPMPFLMEADAAARRLVDGLESPRLETTFPRRFAWGLKLMRTIRSTSTSPADCCVGGGSAARINEER